MQAKHILFAPAPLRRRPGVTGAPDARCARPARSSDASTSDASIRERLVGELERQPWWHAATSNVFVHDGRVILQGLVQRESERPAARAVAERIAGVRGVEDARVPRQEWQSLG
jgi:osmotically-inducible protein OsmY